MKDLSSRWAAFAEQLADVFAARVAEMIAHRVARIVLDRLTYVPLPIKETFTVNDLRDVLACESDSAVYRTLERLRVCAYTPGKYRRRDVLEGIARASFSARQARGWESLARIYRRGPNE